MSCVLTLTSAAIIAGLSISTSVAATIIANVEEKEFDVNKGIDTVFIDRELLLKTLHDFDCTVDQLDENKFSVKTTCGDLIYARENENEAFKLYINEVINADELVANMKSFELDYGRNVQSYTYDHIKNNLSENMHIEEEYTEDDALYITINVD